jgi:hypothetical protein
MNIFTMLFFRMLDLMTYGLEITLYLLHAVWIGMVRSAISLIDAIDDWFPGYDILDNALLRGVVMGGAGFLLGVSLMIFISLAIGAWGIPCSFIVTILFSVFVGIMADPEREWTVGDFPGFGRGGGPQTPLNL